MNPKSESLVVATRSSPGDSRLEGEATDEDSNGLVKRPQSSMATQPTMLKVAKTTKTTKTPNATETILVYAHFDGQPVQEENWAYGPFTPTLLDAPVQEGGQKVDIASVDGAFDPEWRLYARSAGDDKMPVIAMIHVIDALRANNIPLSVNLKLLLDSLELPLAGHDFEAKSGAETADSQIVYRLYPKK